MGSLLQQKRITSSEELGAKPYLYICRFVGCVVANLITAMYLQPNDLAQDRCVLHLS